MTRSTQIQPIATGGRPTKRGYVYKSLLIIALMLFLILALARNRNANNKWEQTSFTGEIQDIVHLDNDKGSYLRINDTWYGVSYNRDFESKDCIGLKVQKKTNEQGFWIQCKFGTDSMVFMWNHGFKVIDSRKIMRLVNNNK